MPELGQEPSALRDLQDQDSQCLAGSHPELFPTLPSEVAPFPTRAAPNHHQLSTFEVSGPDFKTSSEPNFSDCFL